MTIATRDIVTQETDLPVHSLFHAQYVRSSVLY